MAIVRLVTRQPGKLTTQIAWRKGVPQEPEEFVGMHPQAQHNRCPAMRLRTSGIRTSGRIYMPVERNGQLLVRTYPRDTAFAGVASPDSESCF
jgi:hypothetical protein